MKKEPLLRLTKKDFRWTYFNGTGGGGQHRNKHANCVRLFHDPSGASSVAQDQRDKGSNERTAFERLCKTDVFQKWLRAESLKKSGEAALIEGLVKQQMAQAIVEVKDENGKWVRAEDLQVGPYDVQNAFEE